MTVLKKTLDRQAVDTIRSLSIDMIEKANSGHPGMPMGGGRQWRICYLRNI